MHNDKHKPLMKVSLTALALLMAPLTLQAEDKAAEASQGTQEKLNVDAADQQSPGTTNTTKEASSGQAGQKVASTASSPSPLVPEKATWDSFHGQLNAQKYSPLKQITADNVSKLKKSVGVSYRRRL
ncbi:hypothetical protein OJE16_18520 [Pantoea tagorei]